VTIRGVRAEKRREVTRGCAMDQGRISEELRVDPRVEMTDERTKPILRDGA